MFVELEWLHKISRIARSDHPLRALTQVDSQKVVRTSSTSECASLAVDCRTIHQAKSGVSARLPVGKSQKKRLKSETLLYILNIFLKKATV